jgi:hypothetical protein
MTSTQAGFISWELSPDNGVNWEAVTPEASWHRFMATGDHLIWRSTHTYAGCINTTNPTCSYLEIEWLYNCAVIDSIVDVPDDQGTWLRVHFTRSGLDFADETEYPITNYYLFRRIDDISLEEKVRQFGQPLENHNEKISGLNEKPLIIPKAVGKASVYNLDNRYFLVSGTRSAQDLPSGTWEVVGSVPAHQQEQYICLVPTLADSSSTLIYSVYCVSAETTTPSLFYFSPPDSGYSIDNLVPSTPSGLLASFAESSIQLIWSHVPDNDFRYYAIYRSTVGGFAPDSTNVLVTTIDTVYHDFEVVSDSIYYYRVSAFDFAGNESPYSNEVSCSFTGIDDLCIPQIPKTFSLSQNYPNPFNPVTEIRYGLPKNCHVRLEIWNVLGQKVATLVNEQQPSGYKVISWDAGSFASGIYFYRLQAKNFTRTKKMHLLR